MGDFGIDSELQPADVAAEHGSTCFIHHPCRDWEIWGPNGGYLTALALRAAAAHSARVRPANIAVHFLGVATFDAPLQITASTLRASKVATSVQVDLRQGDKAVLRALIWAIDSGLAGLRHAFGTPPDVSSWPDLPTMAERWAQSGAVAPPSTYAFWGNFEQRPTDWIVDWENRGPLEAKYLNWLRFVPRARFDDPWLEAARLALLVDLGAWPAADRAHVGHGMMAPSIDMSCEFHDLDVPEWMLLDAVSPHAGDGLVASHQQVWSDDGRLLASGISHLLCRAVRV
jgi:acyl-CoA thioesterase